MSIEKQALKLAQGWQKKTRKGRDGHEGEDEGSEEDEEEDDDEQGNIYKLQRMNKTDVDQNGDKIKKG
ncbi:MAG: hypothetical protein EZS28_000611 [Streblomastix strix]|uniref:Uncharacterized protein n=1 Tax=Streblomastix strix TaxID=222440 RepID=A0A5J4X9U4_9EUKA|nr:MAG: hypothetical protein EZS28_000611 [Streblomastix strix]